MISTRTPSSLEVPGAILTPKTRSEREPLNLEYLSSKFIVGWTNLSKVKKFAFEDLFFCV